MMKIPAATLSINFIELGFMFSFERKYSFDKKKYSSNVCGELKSYDNLA